MPFKRAKSKIPFINQAVTIKFDHHELKKRGADVILLLTSGKQMSNNYVPCFNRDGFLLFLFIQNLPEF